MSGSTGKITGNDKQLHVGYRPDIDGLRALAVIAVVVFHAFPEYLPGGFVGVDVFFVISGYLITGNILGAMQSNNFNVFDFYRRRVRRIFPALFAVLLAVIVFGWFSLFPDEYGRLGKHTAYGAGFAANFSLLQESGYFDTSSVTKPLLHLWSLGVEEQYYLVWPLIIMVALRAGLSTALVGGGLLIGSFVYSIYVLSVDAPAAFYLPQARFWELMTGSLLAIHLYNKKNLWVGRRAEKLADLLSVMGLLLVLMGYELIKEGTQFPGYFALLPTVGSALLIYSGRESYVNRTLLTLRPMVWVGVISFPLYLWHWPLLSYAHILTGASLSKGISFALVLISFLLAWGTHHLIEKPLRFGPSGGQKAIGLVSAMVLIAGGGYWILLSQGLPGREAVATTARINSLLVGPTWKYTKNDICESSYPEGFRYFCSQKKPGPPTILLFGNSYANHLYGGFANSDYFANDNVLSYGSCEPWGLQADCGRLKKIVVDNPSIRMVVINERWPRLSDDGQRLDYFSGKPVPNPPQATSSLGAAYTKFLEEYLSFFESRGIKVVIFGPKPEINQDARTCFARPFMKAANDCSIGRKEALSQQKGIVSIIRAALEKHPTVQYFDQNEVVCDRNVCNFIKEGLPLLRDEGHYSEFGSDEVVRKFAEWARRVEPELLTVDAR